MRGPGPDAVRPQADAAGRRHAVSRLRRRLASSALSPVFASSLGPTRRLTPTGLPGPFAPGAEQGPSLLRCERKDRAVRSGSSGGWARARKRSPVAEPSWRSDGGAGCHRGGAPQRPLEVDRRSVQSRLTRHRFAPEHAGIGGDGRVTYARFLVPRYRGGGAGGLVPPPPARARRSRPRGSRPHLSAAGSVEHPRWRSADSDRSRRP